MRDPYIDPVGAKGLNYLIMSHIFAIVVSLKYLIYFFCFETTNQSTLQGNNNFTITFRTVILCEKTYIPKGSSQWLSITFFVRGVCVWGGGGRGGGDFEI